MPAIDLARFGGQIDRYRVLPPNEFRALESWCGTFYEYQLEWLLDRSRRAIANKSRQIGLSHTSAALGVLWGVFHGETTTVISIGERESSEVLDMARRHAEVLSRLGSQMARPRKQSALQIAFASGGRVIALPSSGGRSFSGNVILDEYAYQEQAAKVWDGAAPVATLGHRLRVISTPNGIGNEYEKLWRRIGEDPKLGAAWLRYEIPIERAVADGFPVDMANCWSLAKGDPRIFDQLYRCQFLDNALQYLPTDAVDACSDDDLYTFDGEYYAGLDIGRTVDRTVLIVVRAAPGGVRVLQHIETCRRTSSDELESMVARAFQRFDLRRLCVDSSGLGAFPAERMQRKHGRVRVEPVTFTAATKEDLATGLYSAFTEGTVKIAKSDAAGLTAGLAAGLRRDLCAIRREITSAGNVRYDAPHTDEGHADSAWALALALHACSGPDRRRHEVYDHRQQPEIEL